MLKKKYIILIVLMILTCLIGPMHKSYAAEVGSLFYINVAGNSMAHVHANNSALRPIYCIYHGKPLTYTESKSKQKAKNAEYYVEESGKKDIEPSVGYAFAYANTEEINLKADGNGGEARKAMQQIVWASIQWGNDSNVLDPRYIADVRSGRKPAVTTDEYGNSKDPGKPKNEVKKNKMVARSYQYGTVWYEILKDAKDDLFKITPGDGTITDDSLKIIADKSDGTYIVGPYKIECTLGSQKARKILYQEIMSGHGKSKNFGYTDNTKFAAYSALTGLDYDKTTEPIFLQENGQRFNIENSGVSFPDFATENNGKLTNNTFYIKFKPSSEYINTTNIPGEIPKIKIEYLKDFNGTITKYKSSKLVVGKDEGATCDLMTGMAIKKGNDYNVTVKADNGCEYIATMHIDDIICDATSSLGTQNSWATFSGKAKVTFTIEFGGSPRR